ncbi:hypothetical protein PoB_000017300 [Plakobranchus ocellatus]|uniref:Uncharacterized protein n=1 Tax=Plakobranchus ocellatus TaxID=259542 RepID=A0AAV3XSS6_9GAST|nr:hypothetical protein PoB_000017300 [Plakobranchus ocellatus]
MRGKESWEISSKNAHSFAKTDTGRGSTWHPRTAFGSKLDSSWVPMQLVIYARSFETRYQRYSRQHNEHETICCCTFVLIDPATHGRKVSLSRLHIVAKKVNDDDNEDGAADADEDNEYDDDDDDDDDDDNDDSNKNFATSYCTVCFFIIYL